MSGGIASILIPDLPADTSLMAHPQIDLVQDLIPRQISLLPKPECHTNESTQSPCKDQNATNSSNSCVVMNTPINDGGESILLEPDDEARIKAELEIEIERDIEREIKVKIMMLNKKLEDLHVQQTRRHSQGAMERDYAKSSQMEDLKEVIKEETVPKLQNGINGTCSPAIPAATEFPSLPLQVTHPKSAPSSVVDEPLPKISWNLVPEELLPSSLASGKHLNGYGAPIMYPCTPPRVFKKERGPSPRNLTGQSIQQTGDVEAVSFKKLSAIDGDCKKLANDPEHHNEKAHVCHKCSRAARHSNACVADRIIHSRPKKFDWTQTLRSDDSSTANSSRPAGGTNATSAKDNGSSNSSVWKSVVRSLFPEEKSKETGKEKHRRAVSSTFNGHGGVGACVFHTDNSKSSSGDGVSTSYGDPSASPAAAVMKQVSVQTVRNSQRGNSNSGGGRPYLQNNPSTPHEGKSVKGNNNSGTKQIPSSQMFSRKAGGVIKSSIWK